MMGLNIWSLDAPHGNLTVDCLMPNGLLVPLNVMRQMTLAEIKKQLWVEANRFPLYSCLCDIDSYIFTCINSHAERVELVNESRRLYDVQPFCLFLKLTERKGDRKEKLLQSQISFLVGRETQEFDDMNNVEVADFRRTMRSKCEAIEEERSKKSWIDKVMYFYPPDVDLRDRMPSHLEDKLSENILDSKEKAIRLSVTLPSFGMTYVLKISPYKHPRVLVEMILRKRTLTTGLDSCNVDSFVLKICGKEEYLLGSYDLWRYRFIQKHMLRDTTPKLKLVNKDDLIDSIPPTMPLPRRRAQKAPPKVPPRKPKETCLLFSAKDSVKDNYSLSVVCLNNLRDEKAVDLRIGLYQGAEPLTDMINVGSTNVHENDATWNRKITFNIRVCDIPRNARLCFGIFAQQRNRTTNGGHTNTTGRRGRNQQEFVPLYWVNLAAFDYKGSLRSGAYRLSMWPYTNDAQMSQHEDDILNPIGTVEDNPCVDVAAVLTLNFDHYNRSGPIVYPSFDEVLACAATSVSFTEQVSFEDLEELRRILSLDPLCVMCEQEKTLVWRLRHEVHSESPNSLPRLLACVPWHNHLDVASMMALLQIWPPLPPEVALELLDSCHADVSVRKFAVRCLEQLDDHALHHYLLQLVQAVKYESYLACDLVSFLLDRALNNRFIGHSLFWLLRSEMYIPSVSVRFGLILEAYCHGSLQQLTDLCKQCEAFNKLKTVSEHIQRHPTTIKEKLLEEMRGFLQQDNYSDSLCGLQSPLDPRKKMQRLKLEECKYKDSKKKPLWLVWENQDKLGRDVIMLYKSGDDLRQDMLTLQILRIMENIFHENGLDLRLSPYGCLSSGLHTGIIEAVRDSETVSNIQKKMSNSVVLSTWNKGSLYKWLKENNTDERSLNEAVETFTRSCAGYCVATFVLGIGDRHPDNIMLSKQGQLFHIDFGHILGNFKTKLGIQRERVPFVLPDDFIYVVTKGSCHEENELGRRFKKYCEDAFLLLRRKGPFLISLFMMMLSCGIPELTSVDNLKYIRDALALQGTEKEAIRHFRSKYELARRKSWTTGLNWLLHNMARDNS